MIEAKRTLLLLEIKDKNDSNRKEVVHMICK